jgi:hypothetical protein
MFRNLNLQGEIKGIFYAKGCNTDETSKVKRSVVDRRLKEWINPAGLTIIKYV